MICSDFRSQTTIFSCCWWIFPWFVTFQRGDRGGQKSTICFGKKKPIRNSFFGHLVLTRNYPSIVIWQSFRPMIVYSCVFHPTILRRSLTIIFSQREGSSHLASIKAHSLFNPILSNCCSILAQEGQESELECIDIKSWRKMWYSLPSRLALPQTSLARCKSLGGSLLHKKNPASRNTLYSRPW